MDRAEAQARLAGARSGHLATIRPDGRPHIVVVTFALAGEAIVTAIDRKPKRTQRLQRLRNLEAHPESSFLVDGYDEDWTRLWWVRIDGTATIHESGDLHTAAIRALVAKYPQYEETPPQGPVIALTPVDVTYWAHTP